VTDAERGRAETRNPAVVELRVAAKLENLAVMRTLVGAVGTFSDLDFDAVADLRLAVDEACTRLIRSSAPGATLVVVVDPRDDVVVVETSAQCRADDVVSPGSFSWHVLSSLTDEVATFQRAHHSPAAGQIFGITLTTKRRGLER